VWIVNKTGWLWRSEVQGAGFLVDKKRQMIATCDHVVKGSSRLEVYFPFRDAQDRLVAGRDSYKGNETLRKQGYMTAARVLASNTEKDLAILEVDTVPKDAVELALANKDPQKNDRLHIIWHPAERPLWRYCPGIEPEVTRYRPQGGQAGVNFQAILYRSGIFPGGDGSPALNEEGKVVGVNARGGGEGNIFAIAVHWSEIANLLNQQQRGKVR
jgi:S1-C subfamily serine protease